MISRFLFLLTGLLLAAGCGAPALRAEPAQVPSEKGVQAESERLNAWFEETFEILLARDPMRLTSLGRRERYGEWPDPSPAFAAETLALREAHLAEMKENFDYEKLDEQTRLSWRLAEYELAQAQQDASWRQHAYVFNQMFGVQSTIPAFLINQHRVTRPEDAEAYVDRLRGIEGYLLAHVANSRAASDQGIQPPAFVYDYVLADMQRVITGWPFTGRPGDPDSPLMADFRSKTGVLLTAGTLTRARHEELITAAERALLEAAGPAYEAAMAEMSRQQLLATTDDGAWKLPDGGAYYESRLRAMTTTGLTAGEIHQIGLDEVARIHEEMEAIMSSIGFEGSLQDFFAFMRTNPHFFEPDTPEGREAYLEAARTAIGRMEGDLERLFRTFPKAPLVVQPVEPFRERSAGKAFYARPAPDGSRPGVYYANLYRMADMPLYQLEALAFHEGIPGHHMQISLAQELEGIPSFRRFGGYTAYSEGWGLYSELLPKEIGYYADPYSDFGRLAMEVWRAARLVVDTGLHAKRWSREQAVQYLLENTPNPEGDARKAIDRYIVMPGQATAYKIGMLKILELRERARLALADRFDIRDFHDVVLGSGPLPLALLEETVDEWIGTCVSDCASP